MFLQSVQNLINNILWAVRTIERKSGVRESLEPLSFLSPIAFWASERPGFCLFSQSAIIFLSVPSLFEAQDGEGQGSAHGHQGAGLLCQDQVPQGAPAQGGKSDKAEEKKLECEITCLCPGQQWSGPSSNRDRLVEQLSLVFDLSSFHT